MGMKKYIRMKIVEVEAIPMDKHAYHVDGMSGGGEGLYVKTKGEVANQWMTKKDFEATHYDLDGCLPGSLAVYLMKEMGWKMKLFFWSNPENYIYWNGDSFVWADGESFDDSDMFAATNWVRVKEDE